MFSGVRSPRKLKNRRLSFDLNRRSDHRISTADMRKFFCFAHIPKTAGSTFHSILERNFGDGYLIVPHDLHEAPIASENIALFVENYSNRRALGGHRVSLDLPFSITSADLRAIAFVREPLSRLFSEFHYGRHPDLKHLRYDTFDQFLEALAVEDSAFQNLQYRFLTKSLSELEQLVADKKLLLFTTERFEDACIILETLFPEDFRDNSFVEKNVNTARRDSLRRDRFNKETIEKVLGMDARLHALAQRSEQRLLDEISGKTDWPKRKVNFRRRCAVRRLLLDPFETFFSRGARFLERKAI